MKSKTYNEWFGYLSDIPGMTVTSLFKFLPDSRLTSPQRINNVGCDDVINDPVIFEVLYMNGI